MNSKVVYTCITGGYDKLLKPLYIDPAWDYICFTNDATVNPDNFWEIRNYPVVTKDKTRLSRYVKLNPDKVLKEYEYSLYIDANILVKNEFLTQRADELIKDNTLLSVSPHSQRNCVYEEAEACIKLGKDKKKPIIEQVEFLHAHQFPEKQSLYANGIILRKHNHPEISKLDSEWWNLYMKFSKRDQLSFVFVLWKSNIICEPFVKEGIPAQNHAGFEIIKHQFSIQHFIRKRCLKLYYNFLKIKNVNEKF